MGVQWMRLTSPALSTTQTSQGAHVLASVPIRVPINADGPRESTKGYLSA